MEKKGFPLHVFHPPFTVPVMNDVLTKQVSKGRSIVY